MKKQIIACAGAILGFSLLCGSALADNASADLQSDQSQVTLNNSEKSQSSSASTNGMSRAV